MSALPRSPRYAEDNLIWIDMEMTGLQPEVNRVIEVAAVITDRDLNVLHACEPVAVRQSAAVLAGMDAWNTETHTRSGLVARVLASTVSEDECAEIFIRQFEAFVPRGKSPMCGNTIGQDRRFMARWLPAMESYFHYRSIDVSTLKELARRWSPKDVWVSTSTRKHQAIADIEESIEELRFYRGRILRI